MIAQRAGAVWTGWAGTTLSLICWLTVWRISSLSFILWAGLMGLGAIMCFYAGIYRSKWFFLPGIAALIVTLGVFISATRGQ
jgi:hypothetical protein